MKALLALLTLALCVPALADDKAWPQKWDAVYLAAPFRAMEFLQVVDIPACQPLFAVRGTPTDELRLRDGAGFRFTFCGDLSAMAHRTPEACKEAAPKAPPLIRKGSCYRIAERE